MENIQEKGVMMKRLFVGAVLAMTAITLLSCGGGGADSDASVPSAQSQKAAESNERSAIAGKDAAEKSGSGRGGGKEVPDAGFNASIERHEAEYTLKKRSGADIIVLKTSYDILSVPDASNTVQKRIKVWNEEREESVRDEILRNGQFLYNELIFGREFFPWVIKYELKVERMDPAFISFCESSESYLGGVHGFIDYTAHTYDMQSGREVSIDEIVTDCTALAKAVEVQMREDEDFEDVIKYYENDTDTTFAEHFMQYYMSEEYGCLVPWTLTNEGLHIWFGDYMLGGYSFGTRNIVLPYEKHKNLFRDDSFFEDADTDHKMKERIELKENGKEEMRLSDYCWDEGSFMLTDFTELAGVYLSEEGNRFEIYEDGTYVLNAASGSGESSGGYLLGKPGGFNMRGYLVEGEEGKKEDLNYGSIALIEKGEIDIIGTGTAGGSKRYYYSEADTMRWEAGEETRSLLQIAMEEGLGDHPSPTVLEEGASEGVWEDPALGGSITIYEWRGEFEAVNSMTGDSWSGDIIYNGNADAPEYTLRTSDGKNLAELFYFYYDYNGSKVPVMEIVFHYAYGDYRTRYLKRQ